MYNFKYCMGMFHPDGMLNRDQRTAKMPEQQTQPQQQQQQQQQQQEPDNYCDIIPTTVQLKEHLRKRSRLCIRQYHHQMRLSSRVLKFLIMILCFYPNVRYAHSKPISTACQIATSGQGSWWINPNNYTSKLNETVIADDSTPLDKIKLLEPLQRQVNESLKRVKESMENNTGLNNIIDMYQTQKFTWIDDGNANGSVKQHPEAIQFLLGMYQDFQRVAVGIDHGIAYSKVHYQVVVGTEPWEHVLNDASYQLRLVLSEIQTSLMEMNVTIDDDIGRDIIPYNVKLLCDNTDVGVFNAIVYRHYFSFLNDFNETLTTLVKDL